MTQQEKCRSAALRLLTSSDRSESELRERLARKGFTGESVEDTVSFLKEYGYLDDARYALHYLRYYKTSKSARRIRYDLAAKGISKDLIEQAFAEEPFDETELVVKIIEKRLGGDGGEDRKNIERCKAYLYRQGFDTSDIRAALERCGLT